MDKLLEQLKNSKTKDNAFKLLIQQYQKPLYYHIRKYVYSHEDANDILQNTFIKAWKGIEHFRGDCSLFSWLYRIAGNEAITHLNKNKKHQSESINFTFLQQPTTPSIDAEMIEKKLTYAISKLPEKQKQVFILRYYDEMPYEEMSQILETSVGALKASYHHAAKKIEEIILAL